VPTRKSKWRPVKLGEEDDVSLTHQAAASSTSTDAAGVAPTAHLRLRDRGVAGPQRVERGPYLRSTISGAPSLASSATNGSG
jgi:hypothetical protein